MPSSVSELGVGGSKHLRRLTKNKTDAEKVVSKSSLASEMETGEKLRIQVDKLVTEKDHLRTLLASAECKERHLFENLNRENYRSEKLSERGNRKKAAELSLLLKIEQLQKQLQEEKEKR